MFITSAPVFYYYYWGSNVTYEKWIYKSNPKYPSPEKVTIQLPHFILVYQSLFNKGSGKMKLIVFANYVGLMNFQGLYEK